MEAIVLAGGYGTRLKSVVSDRPKPMALVAGRPFLELLLKSIKGKGVDRVILSLGHMSEYIRSYFLEHPLGMDVVCQTEETPLGTGGAIAAALPNIKGDHAFVLNGDTFLDLNFREMQSMWPGDSTPIVAARAVPQAARFGTMEIVNGYVQSFSSRGTADECVINAGCYLLPRNIFEICSMPPAFSFEAEYLARRPPRTLRAYLTMGKFIDIGVPEDYFRAQRELAHLVESPEAS